MSLIVMRCDYGSAFSCLLNCWNALSLSGSDGPLYTSQWRKAEGLEATIVMM